MKILKLLVFTLVICLFTKDIYAQKATTKTVTFYQIQLGAYKNPAATDFEKLYDLGSIFSEDVGNGVSRILLGDFTTKEKANAALKSVKAKGYKSAFVKTEVLTIVDENKVLLEKPTEMKDTGGAGAAETKVADKPAPAKKAAAENVTYVIQLGAYKQVDFRQFSKLTDIGDFYVETIGGLTKVTVGPFETRASADTALAKVKTRGYDKAFVRKIEAESSEGAAKDAASKKK